MYVRNAACRGVRRQHPVATHPQLNLGEFLLSERLRDNSVDSATINRVEPDERGAYRRVALPSSMALKNLSSKRILVSNMVPGV